MTHYGDFSKYTHMPLHPLLVRPYHGREHRSQVDESIYYVPNNIMPSDEPERDPEIMKTSLSGYRHDPKIVDHPTQTKRQKEGVKDIPKRQILWNLMHRPSVQK